jgi:hypothetical protein
MTAEITRVSPKETLRAMGSNVYRRAYDKGLSLSAFLESEMPSSEYKDGLDAYERLLMEAGIRTKSIPEVGIWADDFSKFDADKNTRALIPEFIARCWRRAATGKAYNTRGLFTSGDNIIGTAGNQITFDPMARTSTQIAPAIPLSELVSFTTGITGRTYEAYYLTEDAASERMVRVAEAAEIPRTKIVGGDRSIKLKKYGRAIEESYEAMRSMKVDRVAKLIELMAVRAEMDKVSAVMDVIINGDGNSGTAATSYNLTTLDTLAAAGTLSLKGWLAFKMKFANPYVMTTALTTDVVALQMFLLNAGSANIPLAFLPTTVGVGNFRPINPGLADGVGLGWTADAPTLKIVAIDNRFAIERVFEIGGNISEVENIIERQVKLMTLTEVEGYMTFDASANKVLDVNA